MTDECLSLKKNFLSCLNDFRNIKTDKLRKKVVKARSKYLIQLVQQNADMIMAYNTQTSTRRED